MNRTRGDHIVQRLEYRVNAHKNKGQNFFLQHELAELHRLQLQPAINNTFDLLDQAGSHKIIDFLELDLGTISAKNWQAQFMQLLQKKLEEQLAEHTISINEEVFSNPLVDIESGNEKRLKAISDGELEFEILTFYLEKGYLPWFYNSVKTLNMRELALKKVEEEPRRLLFFLQKLEKYFALLRLTTLLDEESVTVFLTKQIGDFALLINYSIELSAKLFPSNIFSNTQWIRRNFLAAVMQEAVLLNKHGFEDTSQVFILLKEQIIPISVPKIKKLLMILSNIELKSIPIDYQTYFSELLRQYKALIKSQLGSDSIAEIETQLKPEGPLKKEELLPDTGIMAPLCGLVIVWPYLQRFFHLLKLTNKKGAFFSEAKQIKAIFLLAYLAKNAIEAEEHELIIPKVLCGWPLEDPIPKKIRLMNRDKKECRDLLMAIIEHWSALKSTSPEGLQQAFLIREGLLYSKPNQWEIKLERTGIDILLDKVPYGLSIINLPWLSKSISCTW